MADAHDPGPAAPPETAGARRVTLAAVAGAHGLQGEVRLKLFTDDAARLKRYGCFEAGGRTLTLAAVRPAGAGAIARFKEIADRTAAEGLRGVVLTVPRAALPPLEEGEYYHADLIDLPVHAEDGVEVGRVTAIDNFGAGDVLDITKRDGKTVMVPIHAATIAPDQITVERAFLDF
jgi:16S rRNA processing protein RimM